MFDKIVNDYNRQILAVQRTTQNIFLDALKVKLLELKSLYPTLDGFFILGWTPEWNDGEECYHGSETFVFNDGETWHGVGEYFDRKSGFEGDDLTEEQLAFNANLTLDDSVKVEDALREWKVDDTFHELFDTNYEVIVKFIDDTVEIQVNDYNSRY